MLRTALRPAWLAWLVVAFAAVYVCFRLGMWQLGVAADKGATDARREVENRPTVALSQILEPHAEWDGRVLANRKITMTGAYEQTGQFLVPNRLLDGRNGYWVVTPFRTTNPEGIIATVRGWTPTPTAAAPPAGERAIAGTLAQGESPVEVGSQSLPAGQEASIDLARLVNEWDGDLYNAFAFVATERPDAAQGLTRVPPPQPETALNIRNAAYAVQWWVFGLFCPLLWWRMVASAHKDELDREAPRADTDIPVEAGA